MDEAPFFIDENEPFVEETPEVDRDRCVKRASTFVYYLKSLDSSGEVKKTACLTFLLGFF